MTAHRAEWPSLKSLQIINAGEGMEKRVPSHTVCGNVNWCSYGKQCGGSLKKQKKRSHVIQQLHTSAYIQTRQKS